MSQQTEIFNVCVKRVVVRKTNKKSLNHSQLVHFNEQLPSLQTILSSFFVGWIKLPKGSVNSYGTDDISESDIIMGEELWRARYMPMFRNTFEPAEVQKLAAFFSACVKINRNLSRKDIIIGDIFHASKSPFLGLEISRQIPEVPELTFDVAMQL